MKYVARTDAAVRAARHFGHFPMGKFRLHRTGALPECP